MIRRGEIWWCSLRAARGSEPGFRRPVLVVQADTFNQSRLQTVIVLALTSNLRLAEAPGNVLLSRDATGLPKDSVANVSQLLTVDKAVLTDRVSALSSALVRQVNAGLTRVLALGLV